MDCEGWVMAKVFKIVAIVLKRCGPLNLGSLDFVQMGLRR